MDEPTDVFNSYEHDFNQLVNAVRQKLEGDSAEKNGLFSYLY
jgi:hypothetical protein